MKGATCQLRQCIFRLNFSCALLCCCFILFHLRRAETFAALRLTAAKLTASNPAWAACVSNLTLGYAYRRGSFLSQVELVSSQLCTVNLFPRSCSCMLFHEPEKQEARKRGRQANVLIRRLQVLFLVLSCLPSMFAMDVPQHGPLDSKDPRSMATEGQWKYVGHGNGAYDSAPCKNLQRCLWGNMMGNMGNEWKIWLTEGLQFFAWKILKDFCFLIQAQCPQWLHLPPKVQQVAYVGEGVGSWDRAEVTAYKGYRCRAPWQQRIPWRLLTGYKKSIKMLVSVPGLTDIQWYTIVSESSFSVVLVLEVTKTWS